MKSIVLRRFALLLLITSLVISGLPTAFAQDDGAETESVSIDGSPVLQAIVENLVETYANENEDVSDFEVAANGPNAAS